MEKDDLFNLDLSPERTLNAECPPMKSTIDENIPIKWENKLTKIGAFSSHQKVEPNTFVKAHRAYPPTDG